MGTHPNTLLICALTPHDLSRKTMAAILSEAGASDDDNIKINGVDYHREVMEGTYDEDWQISSKEGDLLFFNFLTYGYGESRSWAEVEAQKQSLETWAKGVCERHKCDYEIRIAANYW